MDSETLKCSNLKKIEKSANLLIASNLYLIRNEIVRGNLQAAHKKVMSFLEIFLKFLGSVLYSDFHQASDSGEVEFLEKSLKNLERPSIGHWVSFCRDIMNRSRDLKIQLMVQTLVDDLQLRQKDKKELIESRIRLLEFIREKKANYQASNQNSPTIFQCIEDIVTYRNIFHGHGDISDFEYQNHVPVIIYPV